MDDFGVVLQETSIWRFSWNRGSPKSSHLSGEIVAALLHSISEARFEWPFTWGLQPRKSHTLRVQFHFTRGRFYLYGRKITVIPLVHPNCTPKQDYQVKGDCDLWSPRLLLCWLLESVSLRAPIFLPSIFCKECWMVRWIMLSSAGNCHWMKIEDPETTSWHISID